MSNLENKVGIDPTGVKRGSRFMPFVTLVVVAVVFMAYTVDLPHTVRNDGPLPSIELVDLSQVKDGDLSKTASKKNVLVIGRKLIDGQERLHFQMHDANGRYFVESREEDILEGVKDGRGRKNRVEDRLSKLKAKLKNYWGKAVQITPADQDYIWDEVEFITEFQGLRSADVLRILAALPLKPAKDITHDIPVLCQAQLKRVGILLVFSLVPGLLGMIYRRAFWAWFAGAFLVLCGIGWVFDFSDLDTTTTGLRGRLNADWTKEFFLGLEGLIVVLIIIFRLRRHSAEVTDARTRLVGLLWGVLLIMFAGGWMYLMQDRLDFIANLGSGALLLLIGISIFGQSFYSGVFQRGSRKNIVVCLDGTWNEPGTRDFGYLAETNVFKLFQMLKGTPPPQTRRRRYNANRTKEFLDNGRSLKQIAFYYHGVGNRMENSELGQLFGGAFGMGAAAIVERAYIDVVRVYRPGDRIFVFGFSRGAALARLVANTIGNRGVPMSLWTLRLFGRHWLVWKSARKVQHEETPDRVARGLDSDDVLIDVLGCWDTVGAFGISKNILGIPFQKINLLKDLTVALCVRRAYHMVALDEMRDSFEPSLMDPDPTDPSRIVEVWFSGNHSNIGGGYATDKLSDVTLDFLLQHISSGYACNDGMRPGDETWGMYLDAAKMGVDCALNDRTTVVGPDVLGQLRHSSGGPYEYNPRQLPTRAVIDDSVFERMKEAVPVYAPQSLFDLNEDLVEKRRAIEKEVDELVDPTMSKEERERIRNWSREKLTLTKWSQYTKTEVTPRGSDRRCALGTLLRPEAELANGSKAPKPAPGPVAAEG